MTKPQIWIATFLALFILLFLLSRLTKNEDSSPTTSVDSPVPQTNMSSGNLSGKELMSKLSCTTCHGNDLNGTKMGPPLHSVAENWSRR